MATLTGGVICQSQVARQYAGAVSTDVELQLDAAAAINTAIESSLYTTTLSVSGESSADIQTLMSVLQALGYTVSLSSTTLTINW
jgi:hypothetical protein